jgi:hypothetical protein
MVVKVVSFADRKPTQGNWTNEELAELYRVEHALVQSGVALETGWGITDEGDPWFVFCRCQGEVLVHITRYDGLYRLYSPAFYEPLIGISFSALTKSFVSGLRAPVQQSASVSIHPAALLSVLVAAIFYAFDFHSNPAHAAKAAPDSEHEGQSSELLPDSPTSDALNHTLLGSLTAFFNRASETVSSILAKVEAAAILGAGAVAVLVDHVDRANSDADNAAAIPVAAHQDRPTDQYSAPDASSAPEQHRANADESAPSQIGASSDGLPGFAVDTPQALPTLGAVTVTTNAGGIGNDKATAPSPESGPVQFANFGYSVGAATAQPDGSGASAAVADEAAVASTIAAGLHDNDPGILAGGQHRSADLTLADGDAASVLGAQNVETVNVNLAGSGGSIDLSSGGVNTITVAGDGSLLITGIASSESPEIIVAPHYDVSLTFGAGSAGASPTIKLSGHDQLLLADVANVPLTLDSAGNGANKVTIADAPVADAPVAAAPVVDALVTAAPVTAAPVSDVATLHLTIVGIQDLLLQESAAAFVNTQIQTSAFSGSLTIGLDLQNTSQSVDLSKVAAANYIVGDGDVAVLLADSGTHIQLGSDLNNVEVSVESATAATPASLSFNLSSGSGQSAAEFINLLEPVLASNVSINSSGAAATGVNTIATLLDASLSVLTLTGNSPLTIGAIDGPTVVDGQGITIDAHQLTGALNLNVSNIADTAIDGSSITIIGGSGWNVLTNLTTASTTFIVGPGENTINIGAGSLNDTLDGLTGNTGVNVGSIGYTDIIVDEINAGTRQTSIDGQTSLIAAAQAASGFAGSSVAHQALLFTYQGVEYAFIDASGSHVFDPAHDAIIKLVGIATTANVAGSFHSG